MGAITEKGVNTHLCMSDITQRKGELTLENIGEIKKNGCIWGCDICQDVCPMNKNIRTTPIKEFFSTAKAVFEPGDSIENRAYAWRGEKVIRRNYDYLQE